MKEEEKAEDKKGGLPEQDPRSITASIKGPDRATRRCTHADPEARPTVCSPTEIFTEMMNSLQNIQTIYHHTLKTDRNKGKYNDEQVFVCLIRQKPLSNTLR